MPFYGTAYNKYMYMKAECLQTKLIKAHFYIIELIMGVEKKGKQKPMKKGPN
jgi:hypothetical protein